MVRNARSLHPKCTEFSFLRKVQPTDKGFRPDAADPFRFFCNHAGMSRKKIHDQMVAPGAPEIREAEERYWRAPGGARNENHRHLRLGVVLHFVTQLREAGNGRARNSIVTPPFGC